MLVASAHYLGIFGKGRTVQFVVDVYNATIRDVQTDGRIHLPSNGNPDPMYSELTAHAKQNPDAKRNLKVLEEALIKRLQSRLGNQLRNLEQAVSAALRMFFSNPVYHPYWAKILGVNMGEKLWPREFTQDNAFYNQFGPDYQEFFNNFHTWDPEIDKSLQLGVTPSNGTISFFHNDPPEKSMKLTKTEKVIFGPLLMILFELVASNWSKVGPLVLVSEEDLQQGEDHARKCAEEKLNSTYTSMNPSDEEISAENFYAPNCKRTDPHFVVNPSIFAFVFMLIKAFGFGKKVSDFIRDDYINISRKHRMPKDELDKLKMTEEEIEEYFRGNWGTSHGVRAKYTSHFVARARVAQKEMATNRMHTGGEGIDEMEEEENSNNEEEENARALDEDSDSSESTRGIGGRAPKNLACSFGKKCGHVYDDVPPAMFTCAMCQNKDKKAHKICAQRWATVNKKDLPYGWIEGDFEELSFKVCLSCLKNKCLHLKPKGPRPGEAQKGKLGVFKEELGNLWKLPTRKKFVSLKLYSHTYNK